MYWKKLFIVGFSALVLALTGGTVVSAATITDFVTGNAVYAPDQENIVFVISNKLDFSDIDDYTNGGVSTADVVQALDIPAGMIVTAVGIRINDSYDAIAGCSNYTWTIGDGDDADGWLTAVLFSATASGVSSTYEDGVSGLYQTVAGGKYYSAADTIDITTQTIAAGTIGTWLADDPESIVTEFTCEIWAEGFMAPTKENYKNH